MFRQHMVTEVPLPWTFARSSRAIPCCPGHSGTPRADLERAGHWSEALCGVDARLNVIDALKLRGQRDALPQADFCELRRCIQSLLESVPAGTLGTDADANHHVALHSMATARIRVATWPLTTLFIFCLKQLCPVTPPLLCDRVFVLLQYAIIWIRGWWLVTKGTLEIFFQIPLGLLTYPVLFPRPALPHHKSFV